MISLSLWSRGAEKKGGALDNLGGEVVFVVGGPAAIIHRLCSPRCGKEHSRTGAGCVQSYAGAWRKHRLPVQMRQRVANYGNDAGTPEDT